MEPEESMEEIKPRNIKSVKGEDQVDKLFSQGLNLSENYVLHEPTCVICSSPSREDTEQKYLEAKDYSETVKTFKALTGTTISKGVVENHMRNHYDRAMKELQKGEYVDRIKRYSGQNLTTLDRVAVSFAIITERLMGINSITPSEGESVAEVEKIKSSETARLMGVLGNFLKLQAGILGEMKNAGEIITIPTKDFVEIINYALSEAKTDRERQIVKGILDRLDAISRKAQ